MSTRTHERFTAPAIFALDGEVFDAGVARTDLTPETTKNLSTCDAATLSSSVHGGELLGIWRVERYRGASGSNAGAAGVLLQRTSLR